MRAKLTGAWTQRSGENRRKRKARLSKRAGPCVKFWGIADETLFDLSSGCPIVAEHSGWMRAGP